MDIASTTCVMILEMFIMMLIGMLGYRTKVITKEGSKKLTDTLLFIVTPLLLFSSYQQEYSADKMRGLIIAFIFSLMSHIIGILIANVLIKKKDNNNFAVERMAAIYSNCGYVGIPIVYALLGAEGVFYVAAYLTAFSLMVWTHGVILMSGKTSRKEVLKALLSPNIIAVLLGLLFFVLNVKLPKFLLDPIQSIANMNTPLAMLIAGSTIMQSNFMAMIKNKRIYFIVVIRQILIPIVLILLFRVFPQSEIITTTVLIATACPSGSSGTMFALRFNKDAVYASEIFGVSTLLCILTIPLILLIYNMIFN